jgi:sn-glycerol 3-phosphate transport system permease protein
MERRTIFGHRLLPALLVLPQLVITFFFFLWPAAQAIELSLTRTDAFGLHTQFVGLANFEDLFSDPLYRGSIYTTVIFMASVTVLSGRTRWRRRSPRCCGFCCCSRRSAWLACG